jgi:hypothetical protein
MEVKVDSIRERNVNSVSKIFILIIQNYQSIYFNNSKLAINGIESELHTKIKVNSIPKMFILII